MAEYDEHEKVIALIPGGGWYITSADGTRWPIVAWGLGADGIVRALTTDGEGYVERWDKKSDEYLAHPEEIMPG